VTTDEPVERKRSRRKPRPLKAKSCVRQGCTQTVTCRRPGKVWCSPLCRLISTEIEKAQRITDVLGPTPYGVQLSTALASLGVTWEQAQQIANAIRRAAEDVGISPDRWEAITSGEDEVPSEGQTTPPVAP
jgi:hypothetical protein